MKYQRAYQEDYAKGRPQMYDNKSRVEKAKRIPLLIKNHLQTKSLKNLTALDVGASTGIIDNIIADDFKKVLGTDIDKEAIAYAKKTFQKKNLTFKVADAMNLKVNKKSFDIVICTHVYEHVPDVEALFGQIHTVLSKKGLCYLAAQNRLFPWEPHHNLMFLSWLPKKIADTYVQVTRGKEEYYEHPLSYWELLSILKKKFIIHDYTSKILQDPQKYGYENAVNTPLKRSLAKLFSPIATYFFPTFFWILEKK